MHQKTTVVSLMALFFLASAQAFGGDKAKGMITSRTGETLIVRDESAIPLTPSRAELHRAFRCVHIAALRLLKPVPHHSMKKVVHLAWRFLRATVEPPSQQ